MSREPGRKAKSERAVLQRLYEPIAFESARLIGQLGKRSNRHAATRQNAAAAYFLPAFRRANCAFNYVEARLLEPNEIARTSCPRQNLCSARMTSSIVKILLKLVTRTDLCGVIKFGQDGYPLTCLVNSGSTAMKFKRVGAAAGAAFICTISTASAETVQVIAIDQAARDLLDPAMSLDLSGGSWSADRDPRYSSISFSRSPWEDDLNNAGTGFWTFGPSGAQNAPNPGYLELPSLRTSLSFLWGSVDTYNEIRFYNDDGTNVTLVGTVLGQAGLDAGAPQAIGAALVRISDVGQFNRVEFYSNGSNALELSNISAVPIPPALLMLLSGLLGLGFLSRFRATA
jgi:hypothetical protein